MNRKKPSPKPQTTLTTREPFDAVAQKLGDSLADTYMHPGCPASVRDAIEQLDASIFNSFPDMDISLRVSLPRRLVGMLEQPA